MTRDQLGSCIALESTGLHGVKLMCGPDTPIPGLVLFSDEGHSKLLMVQGDGTVIDLLKVHRLAEDCVRNWHKGSPPHIPQFVGDFGRLAPLAASLNGEKPK